MPGPTVSTDHVEWVAQAPFQRRPQVIMLLLQTRNPITLSSGTDNCLRIFGQGQVEGKMPITPYRFCYRLRQSVASILAHRLQQVVAHLCVSGFRHDQAFVNQTGQQVQNLPSLYRDDRVREREGGYPRSG